MTRGRLSVLPWLRAMLALAALALLSPAGAQALQPVRVSEHAWYVQGDSGMASAANRGFNSNAGFVVTRDSVIVDLGNNAEALLARVRSTPGLEQLEGRVGRLA